MKMILRLYAGLFESHSEIGLANRVYSTSGDHPRHRTGYYILSEYIRGSFHGDKDDDGDTT